MTRQIFAAEISHEDTPVHIREIYRTDDAAVKSILTDLKKSADEVYVIATCNRFAIYIFNDTIAPLNDFFMKDSRVKGYVQFYYNTEESITHLYATASGLLSQVKGEHQILGQIKHFYKLALDTQSIGINLDNLIRDAIRVGKKVRTETGIDKFCSSVVDAGIELLYERMENLHQKKFLVIGTGKIARLALGYLHREGLKNIVILSNDMPRAVALANEYQVQAVHITALNENLYESDVIIGGTHHEVNFSPLPDHQSKGALAFNASRKYFILDFGMPRNFDARLGEYPNIDLYNLDDLKQYHRTPLDAFGGLEEAWRIVLHETKEFNVVLHQIQYTPILAAYWNRLNDVKNRELNGLLPKLGKEVSTRDINLIKRYSHKLIRSISKEPFRNIRNMANDTQAVKSMEVVKNLYQFNNVRINFSNN